MKYLGKLLLDGIVITIIAGVLLVIVLHFFGDEILEILGG